MEDDISDENNDVECRSSSDLLERRYRWVVDRWKNGFSEEEAMNRDELFETLRSEIVNVVMI